MKPLSSDGLSKCSTPLIIDLVAILTELPTKNKPKRPGFSMGSPNSSSIKIDKQDLFCYHFVNINIRRASSYISSSESASSSSSPLDASCFFAS